MQAEIGWPFSELATRCIRFLEDGVPHGYALSRTTSRTISTTRYIKRFKEIAQKLKFEPLKLTQPLDQAADVIMPDRGHLDNNPVPIGKQDVIKCLDEIVNANPLA